MAAEYTNERNFTAEMTDFDYLSKDYDAKIEELESLSQKELLRIEINSGLEEALQELELLKSQLPKEQTATLLNLCKDNVLQTIEGQFGLASLVLSNKSGGNVTTAHNFENAHKFKEKDIPIATQEDMQKYQGYKASQEGNWNEVRKNAGYDEPLPKMRKTAFQTQDKIFDAYSGKELPKDGRAHLDHIVSIKEIESNAKAHLSLSVEERAKIATNDKNLAWSEASANQSKGDNKMSEWIDKTDKKTGQTKGEKYGIDREKALQKDKEARKYVYGEIDTATLKKYSTELLSTGGKDAAKMAAYSAIGVILRELVAGLFEEIRATFKNKGESLKEIFVRFKERLQKILANIKAKWKDILGGSIEAGIMAFCSNIVVFVINLFFTTLKRVVSVIRAGFVSIVQAAKILANPPKDMPKDEVGFAALKILTTGLIGALSLGLAEGIEKLLLSVPALTPIMAFPVPIINETIGTILSTTLSAIIGGLLSTIAIYYMDKWANGKKESNLQIQIMTKTGEVVNLKLQETWLVLWDGYDAVLGGAERAMGSIKQLRNTINKHKGDNNE